METLFQQITWDIPLFGGKFQFYPILVPIALFFIGYALWQFINKEQNQKFYPFSKGDFSSHIAKNQLLKSDYLPLLKLLTTILFALALPVPTLLQVQKENAFDRIEMPPKEGSAIFVLMDQSGSMGNQIVVNGTSLRKIDYLKNVTKDFVKDLDAQNAKSQRKDMIGLLGFARSANVIIPPTFEHDVLNSAIDHVDVLKGKEGEGTSISYAIYKTAHLIQFLSEKAKENQNFTLDSSAIILITDGLETISPEDVNDPYISISLDRASSFAASHNIPLYLIVIYPDLRSDKYAPERRNLQKAISKTLGGLYILDNPTEVEKVLVKISELKKKTYHPNVPATAGFVKKPLWSLLLKGGFILFLLMLFLKLYKQRISP